MLVRYVNKAMRQAKYRILPQDEGYFGEIPGFRGVWANAPTLERCRDELQEVLEDWLLVRLRRGLLLPVLGSLDLNRP